MDIATIIGVICGFMCVMLAIAGGGGVGIFINIPSVLITVGGMLSATFVHFSLGQVLKIIPVVKKTLFWKLPTHQEVVRDMVNYSTISRRDGPLALEQQAAKTNDPFVRKALQMIVDGQKEDAIESAMATEIRCLQERHQEGKKIMEFMGASAPAFGMIGTLIGLVSMLKTLDSPEKLGAGMAVALITTFYGALLANLIFIPLAGKLGIRSRQESLLREMIVHGVIGIVRGESPSAVSERMQAFVSGRKRDEIQAAAGGKLQTA